MPHLYREVVQVLELSRLAVILPTTGPTVNHSLLQLYREAMEALELPRLQLLVKFVLQRVRITVTTSSDVSTALKFFTVSSQRGKQLQPIDVLKGHVFNVAVMPAGKQVQM